MRRVIKFGGTSLATASQVREGAEHVARLVEYGEQIAVVVSAPGNLTSELLDDIYGVCDHQVDFNDVCEFVALGEEHSVHMMTAALRSLSVAAQPLLPRMTESWPLIADLDDHSPLAASKINEERPFHLRTQQTASRFNRFVLPHLRVGTVPVIAGFFALDSSQRVVALGRGGSDITAFIVARQINADEVVIVTDVQGVLSADPRLAENPRLLEQLTLSEMEMISGAGARVIHPRALSFMTEHLRVRLIDYRELDRLEETGTSVFGKSETTLYRNPDELSMLTLVGDMENLSSLQGALLRWLEEIKLKPIAASMTTRFICYYLPTKIADECYGKLHTMLREHAPSLKNLSLRGGIGELRLRSAKFIDTPGVLAELTGVLSNARINIIEVVTGLTDISLFVSHQDVDRAETLLKRVLEHFQS